MQLNKDGQETNHTDDYIGIFNSTVSFGIVVFGNSEITLDTHGNEQRWGEINKIICKKDVQFASEIAVSTHILLRIKADKIEIQYTEEHIT